MSACEASTDPYLIWRCRGEEAFDESVTHVVVYGPLRRTVKFLAGCLAGKVRSLFFLVQIGQSSFPHICISQQRLLKIRSTGELSCCLLSKLSPVFSSR